MRDDDRNSIVSGPPKWRWPWDRAQDVDIGSTARQPNSSVEAPAPARLPGFKPRLPRFERLYGTAGAPARWRRWAATLVILAAFVFHALPQVALMGGQLTPQDARGLIVGLASFIPVVSGFDAAQWLVPAASAWLWQPLAAAIGAGVLRLVALNTAGRDPLTAIWIAFAALVIDLSTWLFMGLKLWGEAYTPEEGEALITLLKVEGGALLVLFFILAPRGRRRLGQVET